MLKKVAAQIDKIDWRNRIERARGGPAASSCSGISFYEDDVCFIRYRKVGVGPAIVFLCDGPATMEVYDALIEQLAPSYTVVIFETPGNGFSVPKPGFSFQFTPSNDAVARFLRAVVGERAILAFSCGGAYAALDIAVRFPELCKQLVVIQAPSWEEEMRWKKSRDPRGLISTPFLGQFLFPRLMKPRAPAWYQLSMADTPIVNHFCHCTAHAFEAGATFALPTLFQSYLTGDKPPLEQPEQATLAIWGLQDESHAPTDKQSSNSLAKSVEVKLLEHVGHFPELEDPVGFRRLLEEFTG